MYGLSRSASSGQRRIARIDGSSEDYYIADGLGSTTALTDDTGNVTVEYAYDAFGNYRPGEGSSTNEFTYAGEQMDETGLQYLRARYYDPEVGRFLNQDPLPLLQRYAYVGNNPVNLVDPAGLFVHNSVVGRVVGDVVRDTQRYADNITNRPSGLIQDTAGLIVAYGSFGDRREIGGVVIYENCRGICSFTQLLPNASTITIGHFIFGEGPVQGPLLTHELVHVGQGEREGFLFFPKYFAEQIKNGYGCNSFEQEARREADQPSQCYE